MTRKIIRTLLLHYKGNASFIIKLSYRSYFCELKKLMYTVYEYITITIKQIIEKWSERHCDSCNLLYKGSFVNIHH